MKRVVVLFLFLGVVIVLILTKEKPVTKKEVEISYELLIKRELKHRIIDVKSNRGDVEIIFSKSMKFYLPESKYFNYSPSSITAWVTKGDSVYKRMNSDSIIIYHKQRYGNGREIQKRVFILSGTILSR